MVATGKPAGTPIGDAAHQAFHAVIQGGRGNLIAAWDAAANAAVVRFLGGISGVAGEAINEGALLIDYGRHREAVLAELDCPTCPLHGTDLAIRVRALIETVDELLGAGEAPRRPK